LEKYEGGMMKTNYRITRTLRCKNANIPGTLGKLTTAIGKVGADIGNIATVHIGSHYTVRDIEVLVEDEEHLVQLINEYAYPINSVNPSF
jgi:malate dehydrogenase (oxaloacetate-decarboxylating)